MVKMVVVLVENEVVVVRVALVVVIVLAGFMKPSSRAQLRGATCILSGHPGGALPHPGHRPPHGQPLLVMMMMMLVLVIMNHPV